jgi:small-conductance mechanosensitive channel
MEPGAAIMKTMKPLFRGLAFAGVVLFPLSVFAQEEMPDMSRLAGFIRWGGVVLSIQLFVGAVVLNRILSGVSERLSVRFANRRPLLQKTESMVRFAIYIITGMIVITLSIRLDSTALTVIGGALAFAVGFAMRDLVAAFIAGITIMFDRPFQVGDRVAYAGEYGDIIEIGLRSVRMNTLDHNIITIPNNKVLTDVTASGNYGALEMQVPMDFYIGADQDVALAMNLVQEACLTSPYVFLEQPAPVFAKQTIIQNIFTIQIKARPYVFDCKYEKPFETDVHTRVLAAFREKGISPPAVLHRQAPGVTGEEAGMGQS